MSEINRALSRMNQVVRTLEGSVNLLEASLSGEQRDMFSSIMPPVNAAPAPSMDTELVARRLDRAIGKIEEILSEEGEPAHG